MRIPSGCQLFIERFISVFSSGKSFCSRCHSVERYGIISVSTHAVKEAPDGKAGGGILGTVFRNDENGWTVLTVRSGRSEVTVVGTLPALGPGEQAVFFGEWTEHKSYGRQFKCVSCEIQTPTTLLGIERYLGSGVIKGIGPATATQIVRQFGEETLTVLSEHPERLTEIPGIGPKKMALIAESYREHEAARKGMIFLQSYEFRPPLRCRSPCSTETARRK